jgi:undecaprenyl-diphosphatase
MNTIINLDHRIFRYLNNFAGKNHFSDSIIIFLSEYLFYSVPVIFVVLWFVRKNMQKALLKATVAALLAWFGLNNLVGMIYYRNRPLGSIIGAKELVFHRPDRSFPSDHASFLFAIAFTLWFLGYKKLSVVIFIIATVVSVFRVVAGVHYPADIVAGFIVGLISAGIVYFLRNPLDSIFEPILKVVRKLRLA